MTAQSINNITFELHSLGWKAFQDLCGTILKTILGQTFQVFGESHDGGRDGAFHGNWKTHKNESFSGATTVQCKFTKKRDKNITLSMLGDEIKNAKKLAAKGLCTNYILMTNYQISGTEDQSIKEAFLKIPEIKEFSLYGYEWINQKIVESKELRMLVPRVYGLGDLSQILDERAIKQAKEILDSMGDDLSKFVITDAYKKSVESIAKHGTLILLGEAASGKSTIAASLAVASKDRWECDVIKISSPAQLKTHWNPHEHKRFFWIDDAFGQTQYQRDLSLEWNAIFPEIKAAIKKGNKFVFTSRDYIFKAASADLKSTEITLFNNSNVVIKVENLTTVEKEQILYNHIERGNQPIAYKKSLKPFLKKIASNNQFKPEIARRFGNSSFTKALRYTEHSVDSFVERPLEFLMDVVRNLDTDSRAAISLIYMGGGEVESPIDLTTEQDKMISTLGSSPAGLKQALENMEGSLVKFITTDGINKWTFKHPTIGDAYSAIVGKSPELLDIYLHGVKQENMLHEIVCGTVNIENAKVIVPISRFNKIITKIKDPTSWSVISFLSNRCDKHFLGKFLEINKNLLDKLVITWAYLSLIPEPRLLAKLYEFDLLPEEYRKRFIENVKKVAVSTPDADFLDISEVRSLFKDDDIKDILLDVKQELLPNLETVITEWEEKFDIEDDTEPEQHFSRLIDALETYKKEFDDSDKDAFLTIQTGITMIKETIRELDNKIKPSADDNYDDDFFESKNNLDRSIFDDIDDN